MKNISRLLDLYFINQEELNDVLDSKNNDHSQGTYDVHFDENVPEVGIFKYLEKLIDKKPTVLIDEIIVQDKDLFEIINKHSETLGVFIVSKYRNKIKNKSERNIISLTKEIVDYDRNEYANFLKILSNSDEQDD